MAWRRVLDVEAGDLLEMIRAAWALLTPDQQVAFFQRPEITDLLEIPEYEDIDTTVAGGARTFSVEWNEEQLAAAGIERRRLKALVRSLMGSVREMEAMGLNLQFDGNGAACLVHTSRPPFTEDGGNDRGAAVAWIGLGLEGGRW